MSSSNRHLLHEDFGKDDDEATRSSEDSLERGWCMDLCDAWTSTASTRRMWCAGGSDGTPMQPRRPDAFGLLKAILHRPTFSWKQRTTCWRSRHQLVELEGRGPSPAVTRFPIGATAGINQPTNQFRPTTLSPTPGVRLGATPTVFVLALNLTVNVFCVYFTCAFFFPLHCASAFTFRSHVRANSLCLGFLL